MTPSSVTSPSLSPSPTTITTTHSEPHQKKQKLRITSKLKSVIPTITPLSSTTQSRTTTTTTSTSSRLSQHQNSLSHIQQPLPLTASLSSTRSSRLSYLSRLLRYCRSLRLSLTNRSILPILCISAVFTFFVFISNFPTLPFAHTWLLHRAVLDFRNLLFNAKRSARKLLHLYQRQLHLHPLSSRAISAGIIFSLADAIAQFLNRPIRKPFLATFSLKRTMRYSCYGWLLMGPLLYVWYDAMHRYGPSDDFRGALLKACFEAITLEPFCVTLYVLYDAVACRRTYRFLKHSVQTRLIPLWISNSIFWFPANFANYYVGTPDMRVIFSNLCSLFWNIYFSAKVNRWHNVPPRPSSPSPSTSLPGSDNSHSQTDSTAKKLLPV